MTLTEFISHVLIPILIVATTILYTHFKEITFKRKERKELYNLMSMLLIDINLYGEKQKELYQNQLSTLKQKTYLNQSHIKVIDQNLIMLFSMNPETSFNAFIQANKDVNLPEILYKNMIYRCSLIKYLYSETEKLENQYLEGLNNNFKNFKDVFENELIHRCNEILYNLFSNENKLSEGNKDFLEKISKMIKEDMPEIVEKNYLDSGYEKFITKLNQYLTMNSMSEYTPELIKLTNKTLNILQNMKLLNSNFSQNLERSIIKLSEILKEQEDDLKKIHLEKDVKSEF